MPQWIYDYRFSLLITAPSKEQADAYALETVENLEREGIDERLIPETFVVDLDKAQVQ